jgi:Leucine-rich repeat (LRR) protein
MSAEAHIEIPKLPKVNEEDAKAVRNFLPGKLLSRTAALLSLVLLVVGFTYTVGLGIQHFPGLEGVLPLWAYAAIIGLCSLAVAVQIVLEWRAARNRHVLKELAVKTGVEQTGYFRIGPYQDQDEDRAKFKRPDRAEERVFDWIKKSTQVPLYLTGDSGCGKSSLLNAFVLPKLREQGWTLVEARAWQDPQGELRAALLPEPRRAKAGERGLREVVEEAAKRAPDRLLIVLDQFEEFVILADNERQREFATFVRELQSRPIKKLVLLLVLRSDYQMLLEDIDLPVLRSGENLFQVARFPFAAASTFMKGSGLDLQPVALDHLLTSAAELDDTPGLVRPITLNVIGYVLASGKAVATSLDAGTVVRQYIERTLEQPSIRELAPRMLEQMITEQGTKQPRSEHDLATKAELRPAEVRAVLNDLSDAGLARPLDRASGVWELSHDFIARAVARFLGRRRGYAFRRVGVYIAPALLVMSLLGGAGVAAWNHHFTPDRLRSELGDLGVKTVSGNDGISASTTSSFKIENLAKVAPVLTKLPIFEFDLSGTEVADVTPLAGLTALQTLDLSRTKVADIEPLKGLTALRLLDLAETKVADVKPLKGLTALQTLGLSRTEVADIEPLKGLTALLTLYLAETKVADVKPLKGLTALRSFYLSGTKVADIEPLKGLTAVQALDLSGTKVADIEPLKGLTALRWLDLSGTEVADVTPLAGLTALQTLGLSRTEVANIEPLKGLTALLTLYISGTKVADIEPLKGLTALQRLDLSRTESPTLDR